MPRLLPPRFLLPRRHFFSTSSIRPAFATGPAPPRLPPKEQEEFERLQRASTGAFSTPRASTISNPTTITTPSEAPIRPQINQSPASQIQPAPQVNQSPSSTSNAAASIAEEVEIAAVDARVQATGKGEELHPDVRRGAKPEFEGEVNPVTGEVGGPKNEPLRWGGTGDWSYNGRVTDF